jgi:hypothetical protein
MGGISPYASIQIQQPAGSHPVRGVNSCRQDVASKKSHNITHD